MLSVIVRNHSERYTLPSYILKTGSSFFHKIPNKHMMLRLTSKKIHVGNSCIVTSSHVDIYNSKVLSDSNLDVDDGQNWEIILLRVNQRGVGINAWWWSMILTHYQDQIKIKLPPTLWYKWDSEFYSQWKLPKVGASHWGCNYHFQTNWKLIKTMALDNCLHRG